MTTDPRSRKNLAAALLFLAPNFLGFLVFALVPLLLSLAGSFTTWSLRPSVPLRFVGLTNYIELFRDKNFYFYLYNTAYLMLAMPISITGSLLLAVFLNQRLGFKRAGLRPGLAGVSAVVTLVVVGWLWLAGAHTLAYVLLALGLVGTLGFLFGSVATGPFSIYRISPPAPPRSSSGASSTIRTSASSTSRWPGCSRSLASISTRPAG